MDFPGTKNMGIGALWFVGGALVTLVTYSAASSGSGGGHFIVTYGAIIIGVLQFLVGLIQFLSNSLRT